MKKNIIIISIILLLLLPLISASDEQLYLTKGVSRDALYQQDGEGIWGDRVPTTYQRSGNYAQYQSPLVTDLDSDGSNEIIIMNGQNLEILNYTTGIGLLIESTYNVGDIVFVFNSFYQTPGLIDYDSDNLTEIIVFNTTHVITLEYNGTSLSLEQSQPHNIADGSGFTQYAYPVIRCGTNLLFESNTHNCIFVSGNDTGPSVKTGVVVYDLTNNIVTSSFTLSMLANTKPASSPLVDVDGDGYLELVFAEYTTGVSNGIKIHKAEFDASNTVTISTLYTTTEVAPSTFNDIIVNNLDGTLSNGMEITYGYSDDNTNWDARTLHADGSVYKSSYCGVTSCPEGESASVNMFEAPTDYYSEFSGDVCYYIRNHGNNFPGPNQDTIVCFSIIAGSDWNAIAIPNTANFTNQYYSIHYAKMNGNDGILTSDWIIDGVTKLTVPALGGNGFIIPVDYQKSGSFDMISISSNVIKYLDDAYTNTQVTIDSYLVDTGNPVCLNEIMGITLTLTDAENDVGYCHIEETYGNGTIIETVSNKSFTTPGTTTLNYFADDIGTKILNLKCQDQFNLESYTSQTYTVTVSNDSNLCNIKGQNPQQQIFTTDEDTELDDSFQQQVDDAFSDIGVTSNKSKSILWLFVVLAAVFLSVTGIVKLGGDSSIILVVAPSVMVILLIIGWIINMITVVPLVIIGLLCAVFLVIYFMGRGNSVGG